MRIPFVLIILVIFAFSIQAQITFKPQPRNNSPWQTDSNFVGEGFIAKDSTKDIIVSWQNSIGTNALGKLYFMMPNHQDSAFFLFHNLRDSFPAEPLSVNLGRFSKGTLLIFMYEVISGDDRYSTWINKRLYSGQNRNGIDKYISERASGSEKRWFAGGRIDSSNVECGVEDYANFAYMSLLFKVSNMILEVREKYKTSSPVVSPSSNIFNSSLSVIASIPYTGNYSIVNAITIDNRPDSAAFKIYYTLDGSNPVISSTRFLYTDSIRISQTTTIKAVGILENDTNWFPSEVVTEVYTKGSASIRNLQNRLSFSKIANAGSDVKIYSVNGKQINLPSALNKNMSFQNNIPRGVYFIKSKVKNGVSSVKKVFVY